MQEVAVAEEVMHGGAVLGYTVLVVMSTLMESELIEGILTAAIQAFVVVEQLAVVQSHVIELEGVGKRQCRKHEQHQEAVARDVTTGAHRTEQE